LGSRSIPPCVSVSVRLLDSSRDRAPSANRSAPFSDENSSVFGYLIRAASSPILRRLRCFEIRQFHRRNSTIRSDIALHWSCWSQPSPAKSQAIGFIHVSCFIFFLFLCSVESFIASWAKRNRNCRGTAALPSASRVVASFLVKRPVAGQKVVIRF
jgi:hypothetical protein